MERAKQWVLKVNNTSAYINLHGFEGGKRHWRKLTSHNPSSLYLTSTGQSLEKLSLPNILLLDQVVPLWRHSVEMENGSLQKLRGLKDLYPLCFVFLKWVDLHWSVGLKSTQTISEGITCLRSSFWVLLTTSVSHSQFCQGF